MKKLGVIILLNILAISSLSTLLFLTNTELGVPFSNSDNEMPTEELSDDNDLTITPQSSGPGDDIYEYNVENIPFHWYDLAYNYTMYGAPYYDRTGNFASKDDGSYYCYMGGSNYKLYDQESLDYVKISTNGYLSFGPELATYYFNVELPAEGQAYQYMVAPFWDDLDLNLGGAVYTYYDAMKFIVEYKDVFHRDGHYVGSFEVIFDLQKGVIEFQYLNINYVSGGYTCGINYGDGKVGTSYNQLTSSTNNKGIAFKDEAMVFYDDFENPAFSQSRWSPLGAYPNNYWTITNQNPWQGFSSLGCFNQSSGFYTRTFGGVQQRVKDQITLMDIDLRDFTEAELSFWLKKITENSPSFDKLFINVSVIESNQLFLDPSKTQKSYRLAVIDYDLGAWTEYNLNLTFFCGNKINLMFEFDTIDSAANDHEGVRIDELQVMARRRHVAWNDELDVAVTNKFIGHVTEMQESKYQAIFGQSAPWSAGQDFQLMIDNINEQAEYWDFNMKYWEPDTDFFKLTDASDVYYKVYKKANKLKSGPTFFIPYNPTDGNVTAYLDSADNIEKPYDYFQENFRYNIIHSSYDYRLNQKIYQLNISYDTYRVEMNYTQRGLLKSLRVFENMFFEDPSIIYTIRLEEKFLTEDMYEENDDFYSAKKLDPGTYFLTSMDTDFFAFDMFPGETLLIKLNFENSYSDLDLALYDSDYFYINGSSTSGTNETLKQFINNGGTYRLRISYNGIATRYTLEIIVTGLSRERQIPIFFDDFESGQKEEWEGYSTSNDWHISSRDSTAPSSSHVLWFGNDATDNYDKGKSYKESISLTEIDLSGYEKARIVFKYKKSTDEESSDFFTLSAKIYSSNFYFSSKYTDYSNKLAEIKEDTMEDESGDGGTGGVTEDDGWKMFMYDLSFFCGFDDIDFIFSFQANDVNNEDFGMMIDDINITASVGDSVVSDNMSVQIGDEYTYNIVEVDETLYSEIFGEDVFGKYGEQLKLKVYDVKEHSDRWGVKVRLWVPGDDTSKIGESEEFIYNVYKDAHYYDSGTDFFIPNSEPYEYLSSADNLDENFNNDGEFENGGFNEFYHYDVNGENGSFSYHFKDYGIHRFYDDGGILQELKIEVYYENFSQIVFMMRLEGFEGYDQEDDRQDFEDMLVSIPGYDSVILLAVSMGISLLLIQKLRKMKK